MSASLIPLTGPLLVGTALEWGLLGILSLQVYTFYADASKERLGIRILVYTLFTLSISHSVIAFTWTWAFLVSGWGLEDILLVEPWQATAHTILSGTMTMLEQLFFCWRLWAFNSRNTLIRCVVVLVPMISLMQAGTSYYGGIIAMSAPISEVATLDKLASVWLSGGFIGDIIVAASMIIMLRKAGNNTYSRRTREVLRKLIFRAVETGSITALAALIVLILFQRFKSNYIYLAVAFLLCNLYSIVVLANINGRKSMASILAQDNTFLEFSSVRANETHSHELAIRGPAATTIDEEAIPDSSSKASRRDHLALPPVKVDWSHDKKSGSVDTT